MGYLIFRGVSTTSLGDVAVQQMPSHKKAAKRMTEYNVKGRDGVLHVDEGFDNFPITVRLILLKASANKRQVINAWADGTGKLISSDDLTRCYKATVKDEIVWSRTSANGGFYDTAEITFDCDPYMYEAVDSSIEITGNVETFVNPGTAEAYPLIKVEGTDTEAIAFDFCGEYIILYGIDPNDPVYIDCETGYIYTQSGTARSMVGNIPRIPIGTSGIYFNWEHPPTRLTVTPRWRWV